MSVLAHVEYPITLAPSFNKNTDDEEEEENEDEDEKEKEDNYNIQIERSKKRKNSLFTKLISKKKTFGA